MLAAATAHSYLLNRRRISAAYGKHPARIMFIGYTDFTPGVIFYGLQMTRSIGEPLRC
jgi:hypothetical protein